MGALVEARHYWGQNKFPFKNQKLVGGTKSDHILVIRNNYKNIVRDVIEPQGGKIARIAKEYELGLYIGRRSIKP